jgi:hypothetical protein
MVNIELAREGYAQVLMVPRNVRYERPLSPGEEGREGGFMLTTYPPRSRVPYAPVASVGQGIRGHPRESKSDSE